MSRVKIWNRQKPYISNLRQTFQLKKKVRWCHHRERWDPAECIDGRNDHISATRRCRCTGWQICTVQSAEWWPIQYDVLHVQYVISTVGWVGIWQCLSGPWPHPGLYRSSSIRLILIALSSSRLLVKEKECSMRHRRTFSAPSCQSLWPFFTLSCQTSFDNVGQYPKSQWWSFFTRETTPSFL